MKGMKNVVRLIDGLWTYESGFSLHDLQSVCKYVCTCITVYMKL